MKILIQDELKAYLAEHEHDTITLKLVHNDLSTGNIYTKKPEIRYSPPHDLAEFDNYQVDSLNIYIAKDILAYEDTLEFVHEKLFGIHACHVKGLNLEHLTTM